MAHVRPSSMIGGRKLTNFTKSHDGDQGSLAEVLLVEDDEAFADVTVALLASVAHVTRAPSARTP